MSAAHNLFPIRCIGRRRVIPLGPFAGQRGLLVVLGDEKDPWSQPVDTVDIIGLVADIVYLRESPRVYMVILADVAHQQMAILLATELMRHDGFQAWVAPVEKVGSLEMPRWSETL